MRVGEGTEICNMCGREFELEDHIDDKTCDDCMEAYLDEHRRMNQCEFEKEARVNE